MRERKWGRIVHVSTGLVQDGLPGGSPYVTAKSGLHGLTRTMSRELVGAGILTNLVMAGFVVDERDVPEGDRQDVGCRRRGRPGDRLPLLGGQRQRHRRADPR
ncbi:SDR family oxidoreductase [Sphaerisporangium sp. NPDC051017]|uniref:SDR family oxidoreductase n=1 Tax=Sphaerisporangium sp. NPDC051017 TaxID=3154636 RepID=UPI003420F1EA